MPGNIKYMPFNKKNLQNQEKVLHTIGSVVSANSSSWVSFLGSLCYTMSLENTNPAVKKSGNNLQRNSSKK